MAYGAYAGGGAMEQAKLGSAGASGGGGFGFALGLVGGGLKAYGSIMQGKETARSYKAQARAKETEAGQVRERGIWDQIRMNEDARRLLSTQRQLYGQAGVTVEGAPQDLMRRSREEGVLDRMMHARNVAGQVSALYAEAGELRHAAKAAKRQGVIGAFSSFF